MEDVVRNIGRDFQSVDWGEVQPAAMALLDECFRIESEQVDLQALIERGPDNPCLEEVLREASVLWLNEWESTIEMISRCSQVQVVKSEADRALGKLWRWRFPPAESMQRLI